MFIKASFIWYYLFNDLETQRNLIDSFLKKNSDCLEQLLPYQLESAWKLGEWDKFESFSETCQSFNFDLSMGKLILESINNKNESQASEKQLMIRNLLSNMNPNSYRQSYPIILKAHMISDLEMFAPSLRNFTEQDVGNVWRDRVSITAMSFSAREPLLSLHRVLLDTLGKKEKDEELLNTFIAKVWLDLAKLSRKFGFKQTCYSALLQATDLDAYCSHIERAKFFWEEGQHQKAMKELISFLKDNVVALRESTAEATGSHSIAEINLIVAKTELLLGRWIESRGLSNSSEILSKYQKVIKTNEKWEKGYFYLGRYQNTLYQNELKGNSGTVKDNKIGSYLFHIIKNYGRALLYGTQYIYQILPRLLTLWLDYGANVNNQKSDQNLIQFNIVISKLIQRIPAYQLLIVFPQIISRICHSNLSVFEHLEAMILKVLIAFPQQAIWQMISVSKSSLPFRARRCNDILLKVKNDATLRNLTKQSAQLADQLLSLCNYNVPVNIQTISLKSEFRILQRMVPLELIIPIQSSFLVNIPLNPNDAKHEPFVEYQPTIAGFKDEIELINSLQRPKKITILGSDGKEYVFLCKPKDDLRKDCRLMEFNTVINKLLRKNTEARKRQLHIRTFCVSPLNEECGLIEWVPQTVGFRNICMKFYQKMGIVVPTKQLKEILALKLPLKEIYLKHLLPK